MLKYGKKIVKRLGLGRELGWEWEMGMERYPQSQEMTVYTPSYQHQIFFHVDFF